MNIPLSPHVPENLERDNTTQIHGGPVCNESPQEHVCMAITYSRVWINRVRLPILLVVS